jgi:PEP-CTERM/exosortase A-associated glycosyltransferase
MKILHVLDHSLPLHSGYTFRTEAIIREQMRLGWTPFMLTTPKHGACSVGFEEFEDLKFYRTIASGRESLVQQMNATRRRILELCKSLQPDIVHAHSPVLNAIPAWAARFSTGIPFVYEVRAFWEDAAVDHGTTHEGSPRYRLSRALESWAMKKADAVTTICDGLRKDIVARGLSERKVTVIPNAVDSASFVFDPPVDNQAVDRLGLQEKVVLGFVGSFYHYEGLHLLLEALQCLGDERLRLKLLLVGGGSEEAFLRQEVQRLGLDDVVIFTGRVPHAEVERLYALIDILVYPRIPIRLTELVTPLKPLEAMAQGRVVLASDVGGHRELIRHGENGFLFKSGDVASLCESIRKLISNREQWSVIRSQARRYVDSERTWTHSVSRYSHVYQQALTQNRI